MTDTSKRNEVRALELHERCWKESKSPYDVILEALNTKDRERDEAVAEAVRGERGRIIEKYGYYSNGCGCCGSTCLEYQLNKEAPTTPQEGLQDNKKDHEK